MVHDAHTASSHQTLQRSVDLPRKGFSLLVRADLGSSIQEVHRQIYKRGELVDSEGEFSSLRKKLYLNGGQSNRQMFNIDICLTK